MVQAPLAYGQAVLALGPPRYYEFAAIGETRRHTGIPVPAPKSPASKSATSKTPAFRLEASYTADFFGLVAGGRNRGVTYLDNLDVIADVDLEKVAHIARTTLHLYALYNNGAAFSGNRIGDSFVASNIETGVQALRLYEAWVQHDMFDNRLSLRIGQYDLNSEFDALDSAALFINSAFGIGPDISQSGETGPSIFPLTGLAVRVAVKSSEAVTLRAAVLEAVPGNPAHPGRTVFNLGNDHGVLLVGETEFNIPALKLLAGYWHYTAPFNQLIPPDGALARGNKGAYLRGEYRLGAPNLTLFGRVGWADGHFNAIGRFASFGGVYRGDLLGRPEDSFGLAAAWAQASRPALDTARLRGAPQTGTEVLLEATYHAPVNSWMTLQPTLQVSIHPGFDPAAKPAIIGGLRLVATHGFWTLPRSD